LARTHHKRLWRRRREDRGRHSRTDATKGSGEDILSEADETIDLLNNERARSFYNESPSNSSPHITDKSNKGIVQYYLGIFRTYGLYVADITYHDKAHPVIEKVDIKLQRLDEPTYVKAMRSLNDLSDVGLTAPRQRAAEERQKAVMESLERSREAEKNFRGHVVRPL
jgi:hypothetical protein